jgi:hypothetical protein
LKGNKRSVKIPSAQQTVIYAGRKARYEITYDCVTRLTIRCCYLKAQGAARRVSRAIAGLEIEGLTKQLKRKEGVTKTDERTTKTWGAMIAGDIG